MRYDWESTRLLTVLSTTAMAVYAAYLLRRFAATSSLSRVLAVLLAVSACASAIALVLQIAGMQMGTPRSPRATLLATLVAYGPLLQSPLLWVATFTLLHRLLQRDHGAERPAGG